MSKRGPMIVIALLLSILCLCQAQSNGTLVARANIQLFRSQDGLPHSTILSLHQDRRGFLWIGTFNGLCRYDGFEFRAFQSIDPNGINLPQAVEVIFEDHAGNIWIGCRSGLISCYNPQTGTWLAYKSKSNIITAIWCFFEDSQNRVWAGSRDGYLGDLNGSPDDFILQKVQYNPINCIASYGKSHLVFIGENPSLYSIENRTCRPLDSAEAIGLETSMALNIAQGLITFRTPDLMEINSNEKGFHKSKVRLELERSAVIGKSYFPQDYIILSKKKIFHGQIFHGIIDSISYESMEWSGNQINEVLSDRDGIIWLATNSGLVKISRKTFYFDQLFLENDPNSLENYVRGLYCSGNQILIGFKKANSIRLIIDSIYETRKFIKTRFRLADSSNYLIATSNTFLKCRNGDIYAGTLEGLALLDKQNNIFSVIDPKIFSLGKHDLQEIWALYEDDYGKIWVGTGRNGLLVLDRKLKNAIHVKQFPTPNADKGVSLSIWCVFEDSEKKVWIGSNKGLYSYKSKNALLDIKAFGRVELFGKDQFQGEHVWNVIEDSKHRLWIGTTDAGVSRINSDKLSITHFDVANGLPSNATSGIIEDKFGHIWVSTMNGLTRIINGEGQPEIYTESDGLISNDFNFKSVSSDQKGNLYFGTKVGVVAFDPTPLPRPRTMLSGPIISELKLLGEDAHIDLISSELINLSHIQNFLQFRFSLLHFKNPDKHKFRYKLLGMEEQWNIATEKNPYAKYTQVPPGDYTLIVEGSLDGIHWLPKRIERRIILHPALWQTLWFRGSILLLLLILIGLTIRLRFKKVISREKENTEHAKKLADLELKALQAQMNPHFIFNAINSIQHYILNHDEIAANSYLTNFARLMRLFLHSSKHKYISLKDEVEMLSHYVALEALRFEEKFDYQIRIDSNVSERVLIPTMILQPFIENSINHGLLPKTSKGKLDVSFCRKDDKLICLVDDNGIGRENAMLLRQSIGAHESMGMSLIQERLKVYQMIGEMNVELHVIDKTDVNGESTGTSIQVIIPINQWEL